MEEHNPVEERNWLMEALIDAADHNDEFNYSSVAKLLDVANNTITRHHPVWGLMQRKGEYDKHREWKRAKYNQDSEWRQRLREHDNAYATGRYEKDPEAKERKLETFRKWIRTSKGNAYRRKVVKKYNDDEEFREGLLEERRGKYRAIDPVMRFLDNLDFTEDKRVILGSDFPVETFEVLVYLSSGKRMTPMSVARRLQKRSPQRIKGVMANMRHAELLEVYDIGVTGRYGVTDYGMQVLDYLARNIPGGGTIDLNKFRVIKRPRIKT